MLHITCTTYVSCYVGHVHGTGAFNSGGAGVNRVTVQGPVRKQPPDVLSHRGSIDAPQNLGGGVGEKGSIDRTITQLL